MNEVDRLGNPLPGTICANPWTNWLVQHGTSLYVVLEMGARECEGMARRYAHLAPENLAEHAEKIARLVGTNLAQPPKEKDPNRS